MPEVFPPKLRGQVPSNMNVWGEIFPPRANPPPLSVDGRTVALRALRDYVTALTFYRSGGMGKPVIPFRIAPENFHIELPDNPQDTKLPSVVIMGSRADYDVIGLVSYIEEGTLNKFAPGTAVQWQMEHVETINVEIWASAKAERRAILAGLEVAFTPYEQMSGIRFILPDYFNELVCFTIMRREIFDEPDAARNRRRAQIELQMRFNVVTLVNVLPLNSSSTVNTNIDQTTGQPVTTEINLPDE
jgi:hypothetical protein